MNRGSRALPADGGRHPHVGPIVLAAVLSLVAWGILIFPAAGDGVTPVFGGPNVLVDDTVFVASSARVAVADDGTIHVVWVDARDGNDGVYHSRSSDLGLTWSPSVPVDDAPGATNSWEPDIAVNRSGGEVYVVYRDSRTGETNIHVSTSLDGGLTWNPSARVDDASGAAAALHPRIAVSDDGVVYAVWEDRRSTDQVFFSRSTTEGASWAPSLQLSPSGGGSRAYSPAMAAKEAGRVLVVWQQIETVLGVVTHIASARSVDAGVTWASSDVAWGAPSEPLSNPDVALHAAGRAYVTWTSQLAPVQSIRAATTANGGAIWSSPVRVDDTPLSVPSSPGRSSVSLLAGAPFAVWDDLRNGNADVFASGSGDQGALWGDCPSPCTNNNDARVDDTGAVATDQFAADSAGGPGDLSVVWEDDRNGGSDIYFARYDAFGGSALQLTEFSDSPDGTGEAVEFAHTGWADIDLRGYRLVIDGTSYDLDPLGTVTAGAHRVVGNLVTADLALPSLRLDNNSGTLELYGPRGRIDVVRYGQSGPAPDPLPGNSTARYFGGTAYTGDWAMDPTPTFGGPNDGPPVIAAPKLVLNEAYYDAPAGRESEMFLELYYLGASSLNTTGLSLVGENAYRIASGVTVSTADPYAVIAYADNTSLFDTLQTAGDNLYLYAADGSLLDMVGWNTLHVEGTSVCRLPAGNGTFEGYDDASSQGAGWQFGCAPSRPTLMVRPSQDLWGDRGETIRHNLTITNRANSFSVVDLDWNPPPPLWAVRAYGSDGTTPLADGNGNSLPDVGLGPRFSANESANVVIAVDIPSPAPPEGWILTRIVAADLTSGGRDVVDLRTVVAPYVVADRSADPVVIDLRGIGGAEETTITLTIDGRGNAVPGSKSNAADIMFVVDDTGSMGGWIAAAKADVDYITDSLAANVTSIRFGLVSYGDVAEINVDIDLTSNIAAFKAALNALNAGGGGDTPEDADVALEIAANLSWRGPEATKVMVLVGDAPTHDDAHLVDVALWAFTVRDIHTAAIACGFDATMIDAFNRTAQAGRGFFAQLGSPALMADAILTGILSLVPPVDYAGRDPDPGDVSPMVRDVLPPYIAYVPGTFVDPANGTARDPAFIGTDGGGNTILEWNLSVLRVNDTWSVAFNVTSGRAGYVPTNVVGLSRISFLDWRDVPRSIELPEVFVTVVGRAPITSLDFGQPNVSDPSPPRTWVTSATLLSLTAIDRSATGIRQTSFRIDMGPWADYAATGPFPLAPEGAHLVQWFSEDNAGGVEFVNDAMAYVDDTPPRTDLVIGAPRFVGADAFVTSRTPLTLQAVDEGAVPVGVDSTEYRVDGGPWIPYTGPFTLSGEGFHDIVGRSRDRLGNVESIRITTLVVDDTPPVPIVTPGSPSYESGSTWVTSRTPIELTASDGGAVPVGLEGLEYRAWFGAWSAPVTYATPLLLEGEGVHHVEARAWDRLGNEAVSNATFVVDDTPPTGAVAIGIPRHTSDRVYVTSATPITLSFADGGIIPVGLDLSEYRVEGGNWLAYSSPFTLWGADGTRTIETRGTDRLDNEAIGATVVFVDNLPPETQISPTFSSGPDTRFTLHAIDGGSGVARTEYRLDGGDWTPYIQGFALPPGDHAIGFHSVDNLGHVEPERTLDVRVTSVVSVETNWKPLIAVVFAIALTVFGLRTARRAPWRRAETWTGRLQTFVVISVPFVAAEATTGIVSLFTGSLAIPPVLGLGTVVDVAILVAGLAVGLLRVRLAGPRAETSPLAESPPG